MRLKTFILILMLANLACLKTAIPGGTFTVTENQKPVCVEPICSVATEQEPASGAVYELPTAESQPLKAKCAIVTADQSLWVRAEPSEKSKAISWLPAGAQVIVKAKESSWWFIQSADAQGYARASYLQETEC